MEIVNFVAWVAVIGGIAVFAIAVMVRAYSTTPSTARFLDPVPHRLTPPEPGASSSEASSEASSETYSGTYSGTYSEASAEASTEEASQEPSDNPSDDSSSTPPSEVPESPAIAEAAIAPFQKGISAFQAGQYRDAVEWFNQAIQSDATFAEAFHNRGLALANLQKDNEAVRSLVQASQAYAIRNRPDGIQTIKQHLQQLAA